jgi:hypothetical protein
MARPVRFALPTRATSASTTRAFACSAAPEGRCSAGQINRRDGNPGNGTGAERKVALSS